MGIISCPSLANATLGNLNMDRFKVCLVLLLVGWGVAEGRDIIPGYGLDLRVPLDAESIENSLSEDFARKIIFPQYISTFLEDMQEKQGPVTDFIDKIILRNVTSEGCRGHVTEWVLGALRVINAAMEEDTWILHMVDSWGKFPEGLFSGHVNALGDFDECVDIKVEGLKKDDKNHYETPESFEGYYCNNFLTPYTDERFGYFFQGLSTTEPPTTTTLDTTTTTEPTSESTTTEGGAGFLNRTDVGARRAASLKELIKMIGQAYGVKLFPSIASCFPNTCAKSEVEQVMMNIFYELFQHPETGDGYMWPGAESCYVKKKPDLDAADISVIVLLGVITALCISSSLLDIYLNRGLDKPPKRGIPYQLFASFSLYTNIPRWLSTRPTADDLGCLHGIRFLSTAWVILAHTWFVIIYIPYWNLVDVKSVQEHWSLMTILNSTVSVDTFFVLSGLLVAYNVLKMLARTKGKLNIPMFYVHRYLRLTPVYAVLVGVMATLVPYAGSGPYWVIMERWGEICETNWWTNMLYVNNFVNTSWLCQGEAWYLANDMQFYIVSPIFLLPLYHWETIGIILLAVATLLSTASPILMVHFMETSPTTIGTKLGQEYVNKWFTDIYIKPYARIQTYFVGMWLGYILFKTKGKRVKIPLPIVWLFWAISTATCLAVLYGIQDWYDPSSSTEPKAAGLAYAGLNRLAWGISISWVIFACVKGYGWLVNDFLSWKVFMPLGRLCYCVYLVSLHLQMILHVGMKQPMGYSTYTLTNFFFGHMVMAFFIGFLFTIMVETPFMQLEKILLEGGGRRAPAQPAVGATPGVGGNDETRHGIYYKSTPSTVENGQSNNAKQE